MIFLMFFLIPFPGKSHAQLRVGTAAPEIKLPDSLGKWTLLSEVPAEFVLIDFWASWCAPCRIVLEEVKEIKKDFADKGFEVYCISLDRDYRRWVYWERKMALPFIHVNDAFGLKSPTCKSYQVESIPKKVLLKNGSIYAVNPSLEEIRNILQKELN